MPAGEQLQYGWLLLKIRDNDRLYSVVSGLSASQGLSNEQQTELRRLWSSWSTQRANDMFAAGDQRRSLAILQAAAQSFPKDRNVENALAGAYLRAGEAKPALAIYLTLDMSQGTIAEYQGAIGAALAARDKKRAAAWLQIAMDRYHDDPIILKMAAQLEQSRGHNTRAAEYYKAALSAMGPPAGTAEEARFTPDQRLMELLVPDARSMSSAFSGVETSQRPGSSGTAPVTERQQIDDQLAVIQGASSSWVGGDSGVSYRSGQPGYDRLAIYSAGMEGSNMIAPGVRTTVITRPVLLESGQPTSAATFQQGTLPAGTLPGSQSASGLGVEIQVSTSSFGAALGYSPHGFLVENVIGRLSIHPQLAHFTLDFSRTPILDTQLSYAGLRDLGSRSSTSPGNIWGGVIANSGELHLAFGDEKSGWYAQGGGQYITGHHVEENRRVDGDSGIYWAIWNRPEYGHLSLGVNLFGMSYEHNLGYFTYGQGGYFSPGAYGLAGVPFTFNGHHGPRFHYRVAGSLGVQAFKEDASPFYPLDPVLQSRNNNPYYAENTTVGGNYNFAAEGAYLLAGHWYVGGFSEFNNSRDYASDKIGFFVRYVARPQPALGDSGPTGLFPVEGLRPLQVP
jgi:tetratricopeptide (TPR) repeat protein